MYQIFAVSLTAILVTQQVHQCQEPAGVNVVKAISETVSQCRSFAVEIRWKGAFWHGGDSTYELFVKKPDKIALLHRSGTPSVSFVYDGIHLQIHFPAGICDQDSICLYEINTPLDELWWEIRSFVTDTDLIIRGLLSNDPYGTFVTSYLIQSLGVEICDSGIVCNKLRLTPKGDQGCHLFIDSPVVKEFQLLSFSACSRITYSNWPFDLEQSDGLFDKLPIEGTLSKCTPGPPFGPYPVLLGNSTIDRYFHTRRVELNLQDWKQGADEQVLPVAMRCQDMDLKGAWEAAGYGSRLLIRNKAKGGFELSLSTAGCLGHWTLHRVGEYKDGALVLDRPVTEYLPRTYQRL